MPSRTNYANFSTDNVGTKSLLYNSSKQKLPYILRVNNFETGNSSLYKRGKYYIEALQSGVYRLSCKGYLNFNSSTLNFGIYRNHESEPLKSVDFKHKERFNLSLKLNLNVGDRLKFKFDSQTPISLRKINRVKVNFGITKSLSSSQPKPQPKLQPSNQPQPKPQQKLQPKPQPKPQEKLQPKPQEKLQPKPQEKLQPKPQPKLQPNPQPKLQPNPQPQVKLPAVKLPDNCNMIVTEYNYVKSGASNSESLTLSGKKYDRVLQNPAYNMMLYVLGDLLNKLDNNNLYSSLNKDSMLSLPNIVKDNNNTSYIFRFIPAYVAEGFITKIEFDTGDADLLNNTDNILQCNQQLGQVVNNINYKDRKYRTYVNKMQGVVTTSPEMVMASISYMFDMFTEFGYNQKAVTNINDFMKTIYDNMDYKPYRPLTKDSGQYNRMIVNTNTRVACTMSHVFDNKTKVIDFPNDCALKVKGGDITSTNFEHHVQPNIVYKTKYYVNLNVSELYKFMSQFIYVLKQSLNSKTTNKFPETDKYLRKVFKQFGFNDINYKPKKYNELQATFERSDSDESISSISASSTMNKIKESKSGAMLYRLEQTHDLKDSKNLQYWSKYYLNDIDFSTAKNQDEVSVYLPNNCKN